MNLDKTAKQLQALFEETNKAVKGNWIAPETDQIVKILRDNLIAVPVQAKPLPNDSESEAVTDGERETRTTPTRAVMGAAEDSRGGSQSSQPKPESWQKIEIETVERIARLETRYPTSFRIEALAIIHEAIERSHAALKNEQNDK